MDCSAHHRRRAACAASVAVSGSKNAALPIMAASILADGPVALAGVPDLVDVNTLALLLGHLGVEVKRDVDGVLRIETVDPTPTKADYELVRRMRASFCVLGPLVARRGRASRIAAGRLQHWHAAGRSAPGRTGGAGGRDSHRAWLRDRRGRRLRRRRHRLARAVRARPSPARPT